MLILSSLSVLKALLLLMSNLATCTRKESYEETDQHQVTRITKCLWAQTFREAKAADIGYAAICYPDLL